MSEPDITVTGKVRPFPLQAFGGDLLRDEAERLTPYRDSLGYWTCGVGHYIGSDLALGAWKKQYPPSGRLTQEQSRTILKSDIEGSLAKLDQHVPWWRYMSPVRQRVLANMCFNMGWGTLNQFGATLSHMEYGHWELAASHMLDSKWATQVKNRAKRLAFMMSSNTDKFPKDMA